MVWEEELEPWARWVERVIFLLLPQKVHLELVQEAFQWEQLHNLEA